MHNLTKNKELEEALHPGVPLLITILYKYIKPYWHATAANIKKSYLPYLSRLSLKGPFFQELQPHMVDNHDRMLEEEAGSGIAHDLADSLPLFRRVAVNLTVRTEGLRGHEGALTNSTLSVGIQSLAFRTHMFSILRSTLMLVMTVELY